jgi:nitrogen-specific signal transduction histidine kinase
VTAARELESELRQARKMEAVGQLAGGVAHDINNVLMAISGYTTFALDRVDQDDHGLQADLSEVHAACERASAMTQQLLAFSRRQVLEPRAVDLNDILADTARLLNRLIGEDIELIAELDPCPSTVRADRGQIEQVLMNLALNARDAMPRGGTLRMKTESVDGTGGRLSGVGEVRPGLYVRIGVEDTGCGMDAGTLEHIFEPFFTTKDVGEGTGLGLATMQGIVKQSGGYVGVESRVGTGTAFGVYLPVIVDELAGIPEPVVSPVGGNERVLLVEDDTVVRMVVRRMLESQGYDVSAFADPHAALASAAMHDFDLLVTDIVMPGMTGRELVEQIKAHRPTLRVLYVSGYTDSAVLARGVSTEQNALLQKPFSSAELGSTVRLVLDAA